MPCSAHSVDVVLLQCCGHLAFSVSLLCRCDWLGVSCNVCPCERIQAHRGRLSFALQWHVVLLPPLSSGQNTEVLSVNSCQQP